MEGIIAHFRGSMTRKKGSQMIVIVPGYDSKDKAAELVGKEAVWKTPGKKDRVIKGKVSATHGNKGALRVLFETGMPGQSLGQEVTIQ